ncbi:DAK2 domain-containing protein [Ornithinimicrobium sp. Y1847]|uniref:DAK2 domain-containing protein n=1 Tax=Ornithinimicrobium sp. Y1847 TaxID=3405419 RepID=UPI003B6805A1
MPSPVLDLVTARRWAVTARVMLGSARERIDALNVFPVADGDTGTNMYLTIDGALEFVRGQFELGAGTERLDGGLALIARGMLLGARGNSGVILSQLTKGLSDAVGPGLDEAGPEEVTVAFETAARTAYDALAHPVEGTILTVARAAAEGARAAVDRGRPLYGVAEDAEGLTVLDVVREALEGARQALGQTPELLPALGVAGVVDAGGAGLVVVIEALEAVLSGRAHLAAEDLPTWWQLPPGSPQERTARCQHDGLAGGAGLDGHEVVDGDVEVMYLLTQTDPERADRLRAHLARIGSSVVVAGGPEDYQVHVHLDDPRAAVEAGTFAGLVEHVRLTSLVDGDDLDHLLGPGRGDAGDGLEGQAPPQDLAVVACGLGDGVHELLRSAGAEVVPSGPRHRASAGQLLAAMWASGARHVVLLPNDGDTVMVARAAAQEAAEEGLDVRVVATTTLVQGLAALAVLDPEADPDAAVAAMREAALGCRSGALTRAERAATTPVGPCAPGQWLGIVDHAIVAVADELDEAARAVLESLDLSDAELLTVLAGEDAAADDLTAVLADVCGVHPALEVLQVSGGQPTYRYLIGAE